MGSREEIVAAAAKVMRERGFAHATTKAVAQTAGYSEAMLYKHFQDKTDLFVSVLSEELPALGTTLAELTATPAAASLEANLTRLTRVALAFYLESFPISMSLFSSRDLLAAHRARLGEASGPDRPLRAITAYLQAEAGLGRIRDDADLPAAALLLLGGCFHQAFLWSFEDAEPSPDEIGAAGTHLAAAALAGLTCP